MIGLSGEFGDDREEVTKKKDKTEAIEAFQETQRRKRRGKGYASTPHSAVC
jgi:hypothetical protein